MPPCFFLKMVTLWNRVWHTHTHTHQKNTTTKYIEIPYKKRPPPPPPKKAAGLWKNGLVPLVRLIIDLGSSWCQEYLPTSAQTKCYFGLKVFFFKWFLGFWRSETVSFLFVFRGSGPFEGFCSLWKGEPIVKSPHKKKTVNCKERGSSVWKQSSLTPQTISKALIYEPTSSKEIPFQFPTPGAFELAESGF